MARPSVRFELGDYEWVPERDRIGFVGTTDLGEVEFLITADALAGYCQTNQNLVSFAFDEAQLSSRG